MKQLTIGEIFRQGLLKNYAGEPYKDKASVSRAVSRLKYKTQKTPWGIAKVVPLSEIQKHNYCIQVKNVLE